jgi:hypothetical protein
MMSEMLRRDTKMTASQEAKANGYKSLTHLAGLSGKTTRCLRDWHRENRPLFEAVLKGFKDRI